LLRVNVKILDEWMVMGMFNKIFGDKKSGEVGGYVDLEKYVGKQGNEPAKMYVRVGEIHRYEDLKDFTDYVYGGNVLILDFSPIAEEEVILKRITKELKELSKEINGDIAGIGNNLMIVSPAEVKVERRKLRGSYL
jgi:SepF-like predicted cell division protein (DUF552 family)